MRLPGRRYCVAMTFNPNAEIRSDNVSASGGGGGGMLGGGRGPRGRIALGGGGGCLLLIIVIIYALAGGNPLELLGGTTPGQEQPVTGEALAGCETGEDANQRDDCLVQATIESADSFWSQAAPSAGIDFSEPRGELFTDQVQTGCGPATSAVGPFYCPADATIYIDAGFFEALESQYGASGGQLSKMYVVAHEYGHHIQNLDGTMSRIDRSGTGPQSDGVRLELQADCYAGLWTRHATSTVDENGTAMLAPLTQQDIEDALSGASAVGDDHIQGEVAGGEVNPDSWTHGSSEQRRTWFLRGYEEGTYQACDTFSEAEV